MRSDVVFRAMEAHSNRYSLVQLAAKATRALHKPHTRIQDTMNDALNRLASFSNAQHPIGAAGQQPVEAGAKKTARRFGAAELSTSAKRETPELLLRKNRALDMRRIPETVGRSSEVISPSMDSL